MITLNQGLQKSMLVVISLAFLGVSGMSFAKTKSDTCSKKAESACKTLKDCKWNDLNKCESKDKGR